MTRIVRLGPGDEPVVLRAAGLFDSAPTSEWTERFLSSAGHHLLVALDGDDVEGFVSGVETTHPDKGTEMFLYELSVHPERRNRGTGRALVEAIGALARERGCYGMWVATEPDNEAAIATYLSAGGSEPEAAVVFDWTFS